MRYLNIIMWYLNIVVDLQFLKSNPVEIMSLGDKAALTPKELLFADSSCSYMLSRVLK